MFSRRPMCFLQRVISSTFSLHGLTTEPTWWAHSEWTLGKRARRRPPPAGRGAAGAGRPGSRASAARASGPSTPKRGGDPGRPKSPRGRRKTESRRFQGRGAGAARRGGNPVRARVRVARQARGGRSPRLKASGTRRSPPPHPRDSAGPPRPRAPAPPRHRRVPGGRLRPHLPGRRGLSGPFGTRRGPFETQPAAPRRVGGSRFSSRVCAPRKPPASGARVLSPGPLVHREVLSGATFTHPLADPRRGVGGRALG